MGDYCMLVTAEKGDEAAAIALSALLNALYETNMAIIVRRCYSAAASPRIGVMVPHIKAKYEVRYACRFNLVFLTHPCVGVSTGKGIGLPSQKIKIMFSTQCNLFTSSHDNAILKFFKPVPKINVEKAPYSEVISNYFINCKGIPSAAVLPSLLICLLYLAAYGQELTSISMV